MTDIHGVLFDCDGTLFSSLPVIHDSVNHCLARQGVAPLSLEEVRRISGLSLPEMDRIFGAIVDIEQFNADYWERERTHHGGQHLEPVAAVEPLLQQLQEQNMPTAVVTTREHASTRDLLDAHDWTKYFDVIIGRDDVDHPKPHPEPVLTACERLHVLPHHCLFVGDTMNDLTASAEAGCTFVGVLTGMSTREELEKAGARHVYQHAGEVVELLS